jgi:hypothetical protein
MTEILATAIEESEGSFLFVFIPSRGPEKTRALFSL